MSFVFADRGCSARLREALSGLAFIFLASGSGWNAAIAGDGLRDAHSPLPLAMKDFQAFVQELAAEADGSDVVMAKKLRALGFSCAPVSEAVQFECVRFGCRKAGFLGRGALLQWSVAKYDLPPMRTGFNGAAIDYSWVARCIPEGDVEEAQNTFLSRRNRARN